MGGLISDKKEAPIYFGGKDERLWFIDGEYNRKRDDFDYNVMNSLVAVGIGDNRCPTKAQWAEFCVISGIISAFTDVIALPIPRNASMSDSDLEKYSWYQLWTFFGDYQENPKREKMERYKRFTNEFVGALMRIFIIRQHTVDGPGRPYNQSYFVSRWNSFNHYPDWFNDKVGNVRLCHLQRGREVFQCFSKEIQKMIELIANHIPPMLKEVNISIKE